VSPFTRAVLRTVVLLAVCLGLFLIFPRVFAFTEMAARELLYFWWLILLVALACWLIWGFRKRR
jgi:uncharacterized protein with PQ loop repeat